VLCVSLDIDAHMYFEALVNKEIEEVLDPENPTGPTMFKYKIFSETEATVHKKMIKLAKEKDDPMDLDFNFEDIDLGWNFKTTSNALADLAAGKLSKPLPMAEAPSGRVASGTGSSGSQDKPKSSAMLAIEDAQERDKLLIKAEEAIKGCVNVLFKAKKVITSLPATLLAKKHKEQVSELKTKVAELCEALESVTINGTLPGSDELVPLAKLKEMLKDLFSNSKQLAQACVMAQTLMPKPVKVPAKSTEDSE
jgi:hypothetical protein